MTITPELIPKKLITCAGLGFPLPGMTYADHLRIAEAMRKKDPQINFNSLRLIGDELWNFIDGKRPIKVIAEMVQFEFDFEIDITHFIEMFTTLQRSGYIQLPE